MAEVQASYSPGKEGFCGGRKGERADSVGPDVFDSGASAVRPLAPRFPRLLDRSAGEGLWLGPAVALRRAGGSSAVHCLIRLQRPSLHLQQISYAPTRSSSVPTLNRTLTTCSHPGQECTLTGQLIH